MNFQKMFHVLKGILFIGWNILPLTEAPDTYQIADTHQPSVALAALSTVSLKMSELIVIAVVRTC